MKTDKVIYRTRTRKEYDWLMNQLENEDCRWLTGRHPKEVDVFGDNNSQTCIRVTKDNIGYAAFDFYESNDNYNDYEFIEVSDIMPSCKDTKGKPKLSLVPTQILFDISEVREYGNQKYPSGGKDNWKNVDVEDYKDALLRHTLKYLQDPKGKDSESGIEHYKHMACNIAFICEMEAKYE